MRLASTAVLAVILVFYLAACTVLEQQPVYSKPPLEEQSIASQVEHWLQRAESRQEPGATEARLKAANLLLDDQQPDKARQILEQTSQSSDLPPVLLAERAIVDARLLYSDRRYADALAMLDSIDAGAQLGQEQEVKISLLRARTLRKQNKLIASARQRIFIAPLLTDTELQERNHNAIWKTLIRVPVSELETEARAANSRALRGWLTLALLHRFFADDLVRQDEKLTIWLAEWPDHPAAERLPEQLATLRAGTGDLPASVTLLLPLSGKLGGAGAAIRDGFFAALYHSGDQSAMQVKVIDSNTAASFIDLYASLAESGTDMIIGPLQKDRVQALSRFEELPAATLALNYADNNAISPLYQFALSVEDEASQIAERGMLDAHRRAMIICPDNAWGDRAAAAFNKQWSELGGTTLDQVRFSKAETVSAQIKEALHVHISERRARRIEQIVQTQIEFAPRRRKDVDMIFLAARPQEARSLKPILAFHYGGNIPVYATSHIYSGNRQWRKDSDLNGIVFADMPWILDADKPLKKMLADYLPDESQRYGRMHAFGADAFRLMSRLQQLETNPEAMLRGDTGLLYMSAGRKIHRRLDFARIKLGLPVRIPDEQQASAGVAERRL